jgi:mono/diheme cytochrome c family protein
MFLFALIACSGSEDTGLTGDATAGEAVYTAACSGCHGAAGEGGSGPVLDGALPATDAAIEDVIVNGTGSMAPVDLIDQDRADLIAYLRATF